MNAPFSLHDVVALLEDLPAKPGRSGTGRARHAPLDPLDLSGNATLLPGIYNYNDLLE